MAKYSVAVVGATGAVGQEMLRILEERDFPVRSLKPLASERSRGRVVEFKGEKVPVEVLSKDSFRGVELVLASAGAGVSREFMPYAVRAGAVVVDNSSAFRMEEEVPLVVPEVNPHRIKEHQGIIANPNCSTIQMVVALKPIYDRSPIRRVVVSTYQAVSGAGAQALFELQEQIRAWAQGEELQVQAFPYQIFNNLIPQIGDFYENGSTTEDLKMVNETKKIMEDPNIRVSATTVRVPVMRAHSESINIETEEKVTATEAREILRQAAGIVVIDDPQNGKYPMPLYAAYRDEVFVGRIREDDSIENGLNLWVVADNLRKGAALNAVQIAEILIREGMDIR